MLAVQLRDEAHAASDGPLPLLAEHWARQLELWQKGGCCVCYARCACCGTRGLVHCWLAPAQRGMR